MPKGHIALSIHQVCQSPYPGYYTTLHLTNAHDVHQLAQLGENLKYIKSLLIDNKEVTVLPEDNIEFSMLTHLSLKLPSLSILPRWISQCTQLQTLKLDSTSNSCCMHFIMENDSLESITFINCKLDIIPLWIKQQRQLKRLIIHKAAISEIPTWVTHLTAIEHIEICSTHLSSIPSNLNHLTHLRTLDLHSNNIKEIEKSDFHGCEMLEHINLSNNPISYFLSDTKSLKSLTSINIDSTYIHDVRDILRLSHTKHIHLPSFFKDNPWFSMELYKEIGKLLLFEEDKCEILSSVLHNGPKSLANSGLRTLLSALHIKSQHIDRTAMRILQPVDSITYIPEGTHIALLSKTSIDIQNASKYLVKGGIILQPFPNQNTTHLVIGREPAYLHLLNSNQQYQVIPVTEFQDYYLKHYHPFWNNGGISDTIEKLTDMFLRGDEYSLNTGLEILHKHGAIKETITLLSIAYLSSSGKIHYTSRQLLNKYTCFSFHEQLQSMYAENVTNLEELLKLERLFPHFNASMVWEFLPKKA